MLRHSNGFERDSNAGSFLLTYPTAVVHASTVYNSPETAYGVGGSLKTQGLVAFAKTIPTPSSRAVVCLRWKAQAPEYGMVLLKITAPNATDFFSVKITPGSTVSQFRFTFYDTLGTIIFESCDYPQDTWLFVEVLLLIGSGSNGALALRVDEVLDFKAQRYGIDTTFQTGGQTTWTSFYVSLQAQVGGWVWIDDLVVMDHLMPETGCADFIGDHMVGVSYPVEDVASSGASLSPDATQGSPILVLIGTTNADGKGTVGDLPIGLQGPIANILIWNPVANHFEPIQAGFNNSVRAPAYGGAEIVFGPEMKLMSNFQTFHGGAYPVGLIKLAVPEAWLSAADDINGWNPAMEGKLYAALRDQLFNAVAFLGGGQNTYFRGIFWLQGENDATNLSAATNYYGILKELLTKIRRDILLFTQRDEVVPIVLGQLQSSSPAQYKLKINQAHEALESELPRTGVVNTSSLPTQAGGARFTSAGLLTLGDLLYAKWQALIPHYSEVDDARTGSSDSGATYVQGVVGADLLETYRLAHVPFGNQSIRGAMVYMDASLSSAGSSATLALAMSDLTRKGPTAVASDPDLQIVVSSTLWTRFAIPMHYDLFDSRSLHPDFTSMRALGFAKP